MFKTLLASRSKLFINKEFWAVLAVTFIALVLRVYRLGANDLWYDEVFSVIISKSFSYDWNPPLYFALLSYWIKLFGTSGFALRFLSLIFSVLSVPCLYLLGKTIFNRRVGFYASVIICLSGFHLWYAQEARPYSLSVFLSIISTYFFYRFLIEKKIKFGLIYALFTLLGIFSNITYYHLFLLFAQVLAAGLFIKRNTSVKLSLIFLTVLSVFAFHAEKFISKLTFIRAGYWIPIPTLKTLVITIDCFNLGYNSPVFLYWFSNVLILALLIAGFLLINLSKEEGKRLIFISILIFLPWLLVFIFSKLFFPVYLDRGMIIFSPYYYLLICFGIDYLKNFPFKKFIVGCLSVSLVLGLVYYYRNLMFVGPECRPGVILKKPYQPALRYIENNFQPGDIVMHTNSSTQDVFKFYSQKKEIEHNFLFAAQMLDYCWHRRYVSGPGAINIEELKLLDARRIWVVSCDWWRGKDIDDNSVAVNQELSGIYKCDLELEFDGIRVYRYLKR